MSEEIRAVTHITVKPGLEAEFIPAFAERFIAPTLKEPGCLAFELHQVLGSPCEFIIFHRWETREHLDNHLNTRHFLAIAGDLDHYLASLPILSLVKHLA
ncbi:hypothetical protein DB346_22095 [Verrucomicrobia bacterium LW23]|nr:hypothetical protein DB346_22095 [Verrucomicrobia bacterium LW23]